ncbi:MAG: arylsulfatase [Limisphaerales bacterium]
MKILTFLLAITVTALAERPNIVLIMADDMGWSDLGCYGGEIRTPNIDSLAQGGMRFTRFYNNAVCGATRASLLTGLYCQQTGHSGRAWNQPKNYNRCVLIPEVLQANGYHTAMVGKWQGRDPALERGFTRFFGPMCQGKISYWNEVKANPFYLDRKRWRFPEGFFMTDAFNDHAEIFTQQAVQQEKPFFLYLAYIAPHWPLHAPERYIAPYREQYLRNGWDYWRTNRFAKQQAEGLIPADWKLSPRAPGVRNWEDDKFKKWQAERMAVYAAQISTIDHGVGRVLKVLKESGKLDNTLILFLSDNGAARDGGVVPSKSGFGFSNKKTNWRLDAGQIRGGSGPDNLPGPPGTFAGYGHAWANVSGTPFNNFKASAYEGGIRTPLIAQWPGNIKADTLTRQSGHIIDIMATCLDVAGVGYPKQFGQRKPLPMEGKPLTPIFRGQQRNAHDFLAFDAPRNQSLIAGDWKIVNPARGKPWELYNLKSDATETTNLATKHPDRVADLAAIYTAWAKRVNQK